MTRKLTLQAIDRLAKVRGGMCLSDVYISAHTKLLWQCAKGHRWEAAPSHIIRGSWCPYCAGRGKTINELKLIAEARRGKCLSKKYLGARVKHSWQCSKKHKWEATFDSVRRGSWCPVCAGQGKTIEDMRKLARIRGGKCLSTAYVSSRTKLLWECEKAHQWKALPTTIARGSWCPICRSTKLTIEQMYQLAKDRAGKCLSVKYTDASTKLLWMCAQGHRWEAVPKHIKEGRWCPTCARSRRTELKANLRGILGGKPSKFVL